jgi:Cys-tRNA(Pro)/Cys-tRNA(Cys) deacylase
VAVVLEATALGEPRVFLNGGQRGLQVEMAPKEIVRVLSAVTAGIVA